MTDTFRLTLAQLNPMVGRYRRQCRAGAGGLGGRAARRGRDMVALTEMFVTGYQTQDLVLKPAFVTAAMRGGARRWRRSAPMARPWASAGRVAQGGQAVQRLLSCCRAAGCTAAVLKHHLPNDAVFDEKRVFASADVHGPYADRRRCGSARRSARMPGIRMWPRRWPRPGRRFCWCRTARPITGASRTCG